MSECADCADKDAEIAKLRRSNRQLRDVLRIKIEGAERIIEDARRLAEPLERTTPWHERSACTCTYVGDSRMNNPWCPEHNHVTEP